MMIDANEVQKLYIEQHLSIRKVASIVGVGKETLRQFMIRSGIKVRTHSEAELGQYNPVYKPDGYKRVHKGYVMVKSPNHPLSDKKGFVGEHILVAEQKLGRSLVHGEQVHHIDRNRSNNNPDNILVFSNHREHMKWHVEHDGEWLFQKGQIPHNKGVSECPNRTMMI